MSGCTHNGYTASTCPYCAERALFQGCARFERALDEILAMKWSGLVEGTEAAERMPGIAKAALNVQPKKENEES